MGRRCSYPAPRGGVLDFINFYLLSDLMMRVSRNLLSLLIFFIYSPFLNAQPVENLPTVSKRYLVEVFESHDQDTMESTLNKVKRDLIRVEPEVLEFVFQIWKNEQQHYPSLSWQQINSPRIRIELGNVLVQASNNHLFVVNRNEIRNYARQVAKGGGGQRTALLTLGLLNDTRDIKFLQSEAMKENPDTFRATVLALAEICAPGSEAALGFIRKHVTNEDNLQFVSQPISELAPYKQQQCTRIGKVRKSERGGCSARRAAHSDRDISNR